VAPLSESGVTEDRVAKEKVFTVVFRNEPVTSADKAVEIVPLILKLDLCDYERKTIPNADPSLQPLY
jgi:hypothetical protein